MQKMISPDDIVRKMDDKVDLVNQTIDANQSCVIYLDDKQKLTDIGEDQDKEELSTDREMEDENEGDDEQESKEPEEGVPLNSKSALQYISEAQTSLAQERKQSPEKEVCELQRPKIDVERLLSV